MIALLGKIAGRLGSLANGTTLGMLAAAAIICTAVGAAITAALALLPPMPAVPAPPPAVKWINWAVPVPELIVIFTTFLSLDLVWMVVRIVLQYFRAA
jgi:hypothetical protein